MKKLLIILAILLTFTGHVQAIYEPQTVPNNKAGIHILETAEIESAAKLVNSSGGDWGYVTIPIQPTDKDKEKWTAFMEKCSELHLIPILRITNLPMGGTWAAANDTDLVDFANFLNELPWPIENRYVIIFNEVNRSSEWGGRVDPDLYAKILKNSYLIFKDRNPDFFILPAGLDLALPNSDTSMRAIEYLTQMKTFDPEIWSYIDGWSSHSYPNPNFSASPYKTGWQSITGYKNELSNLGLKELPVFITETGWDKTQISSFNQLSYYKTAWQIWNADPSVVAVTPFLLKATGQFEQFSFVSSDGSPSEYWQALEQTAKDKGEPRFKSAPPKTHSIFSNVSDSPGYSPSLIILNIENIFRSILGLPEKAIIQLASKRLTAEIVSKPKDLERGLSGRSKLADNSGMLFYLPYTHTPSFWMKDMQIALDIIWLKDGVVVDISKNIPPSQEPPHKTYSPKVETNQVLEVISGWTEKNNIKLGDKLSIIYPK